MVLWLICAHRKQQLTLEHLFAEKGEEKKDSKPSILAGATLSSRPTPIMARKSEAAQSHKYVCFLHHWRETNSNDLYFMELYNYINCCL